MTGCDTFVRSSEFLRCKAGALCYIWKVFPAQSRLFMNWSAVEALWKWSTEPLLCSLQEVYGYYLITHELFQEAFGEKHIALFKYEIDRVWITSTAGCPPWVLCLNYPKWWLLLKGHEVKDWFCWEHKVITIATNDGLISSSFFFFWLRKLYPDFEKGPEFYSLGRLCQGLRQGGSHERVKTQLTPLGS